MKILKIKVPNGFMMLKPGFELNLMTKTRVDNDVENDDLLQLEDNFYYPIETAFIGKNSSGKTTVIRLIALACNLLNFGRVFDIPLLNKDFKIEIIFYNKGYIFKYDGCFGECKNQSYYLTIINESLEYTTLKTRYNKDLSNAAYFMVKDFSPNIGLDTSFVSKYSSHDFSLLVNSLELMDNIFESFFKILSQDVITKLINLFDDSVEYIKLPNDIKNNNESSNTFLFKRVGSPERLIEKSTLKSLLSEGTIRGMKFYGAAIIAFKEGGTIMIDEIEKNFNKNLILNLIDMFNDTSINKAGATLIYSTHYAEILDNSSRCDNINVMHRDGTNITLKNMSTDYEIRTELKKSDQFDQNAFDNLINYDALMNLKRSLRG